MARVVEVKNLSCVDRRRGIAILDNVSFHLEEGEMLLVVGPNGGGKSTLIRILAGGAGYLKNVEIRGYVYVAGIDVLRARPTDLAGVVGLVLQNPVSQLTTASVEEEIAFPLENLLMDREEIVRRIEKVMDLMRISHLRYRATHELSVGEMQRVLLASALAPEPKVLLLDEPLAYLDPVSRRKLVEHLLEVKRMGTAIVVAEHDLENLAPYADKILVLNRRVIAFGRASEILTSLDLERYGVRRPLLYVLASKLGCRDVQTVEEVLRCIARRVCS